MLTTKWTLRKLFDTETSFFGEMSGTVPTPNEYLLPERDSRSSGRRSEKDTERLKVTVGVHNTLNRNNRLKVKALVATLCQRLSVGIPT